MKVTETPMLGCVPRDQLAVQILISQMFASPIAEWPDVVTDWCAVVGGIPTVVWAIDFDADNFARWSVGGYTRSTTEMD